MKKKKQKPRKEVVLMTEEEVQQEEKKHGSSKKAKDDDACTVIDFRPVPETGKALQFVHAGGKVYGTVLKINPDGTFYAVGSNGIKYPTVHNEDIMQEGETASQHISKRATRSLNNVGNSRVTGKEVKRVRSSSPSVPGQWKEPAPGSIIHKIIELHKQGFSKADIIAKGFNKSTVARQVSEYIKAHSK